MDMRNGDLYPSKELALAASVPPEHLQEVEPVIVRITSGPFKGRVYQRSRGQLERRPDLEPNPQEA